MYNLVTAKLLYDTAEKMDLKPKWLTDYGLFSIQYKKQILYVFYSTSYLNNQLSSYLAKNKHATRIILGQHNLPNIPYCTPDSEEEAFEFFSLHKIVIAKPTMGRHSQNIVLVSTSEQLKEVNLKSSILEKYIEGTEYRVLVLKDKPIAFHSRYKTTPINDPEKVKRISYPENKWNKKMIDLALQSMRALSLDFGCVDFIIDNEDRIFILEVNSAPGITSFEQPDEGPKVEAASMFLRETLKRITTKYPKL